MGALDDAIREHLELKRRHGASEDEIKQAEAEALGPARRVAGSGAGALPGETALDEAGMPAPVEAVEPPPDPRSGARAPPAPGSRQPRAPRPSSAARAPAGTRRCSRCGAPPGHLPRAARAVAAA